MNDLNAIFSSQPLLDLTLQTQGLDLSELTQENTNLKIYIPTCNNYIKYVEAVLYTFKKYWYDYDNYEVVILGYKPPEFELHKNVTFYSMGEDDSVGKWSNGLIKYFESIDDEWIIHWNDDCPLSGLINVEILNLFYDKIRDKNTDPAIVKYCLMSDTSSREHIELEDHGDFKLIEAEQGSDYRLSLPYQIWNRKYFLKNLPENTDPWKFETQHPKHDGYRMLGTKGKFCTDMYQLMRRENIWPKWNTSLGGVKMGHDADDYAFISGTLVV